MEADSYTIRSMTVEEVSLAVAWAAAEGWNPGLNDGACYRAADGDGFLVGLLDGAPIATISAMLYGATFGFLGFYIVRPDRRGQGYGIRIWDAAMRRLKGRNIGLDGVVTQQDNYRKSGFRLAHNNIRFEGSGGGDGNASDGVVSLSRKHFDAIARYSLPFFPEPRPGFLGAWIDQAGARTLGVLRDDNLAGYGVIRPCLNGHKIGPLFADTPDTAETLFRALKGKAPVDAPVFLDVPETNPAAVALAERHAMERIFETARMYTGPTPDIRIERTFGITSFEIG